MVCCHDYVAAEGGDSAFSVDMSSVTFGAGCLAAAREEIRHDRKTGRPYRANHVYTASIQGELFHRWVDIDEAPREPMHKSLTMRREQIVGDGLQLTLDAEHWNDIHSDEDPIIMQMDFTDDVEWRKAAPRDEDQKAS